ncbi:mesoderm induction early response protein 1 [Drosophila mojavensis]|uniref:Mesoderm induction early response protein 1 n=1 Tax=Drosophila mojavensis TaxID=7230 RepID=B4KQ49_DROMO|nr:mesoderm induction early response protein 1 [Drosophila mojavensis]EDW08151.1 uncharacterized protein Dmoj_GI19795 [Drosophila mojavensis]
MAGRELTVTPTKRERRKSPAMASCSSGCSTSQQPPPPPPPMSPSSSVADTTFEPTVDMMVNDFDDEATLNEEEALADLEAHNVEDEIATLRAESEMPIELLLAKYGNMDGTALGRPCSSSSSGGGSGSTSSRGRRRAPKRPLEDAEQEQEQPAEPNQAEPASPMQCHEGALDLEDLPPELAKRSHRSHLLDLYPEQQALDELESFTPLETLLEQAEDEDQEDDSDTDSDDTKKMIMIGPDYQADIPEGLALYVADVLPYENEDQLIWAPSQVSERDVEEYLAKIQETRAGEEDVVAEGTERNDLEEIAPLALNPTVDAAVAADPVPSPAPIAQAISDGETVVKDNEQALHLLVQCGYDFKEALRRKRMNVLPLSDTMSSWSEEECQKFEEGIQKFGKDFYQIRQNQVRTRTMRELVQFYYQWKKSERRDQTFALNDTIDHMDVFINEGGNGNGTGNGNGSCSSLASSGSSSNGHSNGNAAVDEKDAAMIAVAVGAVGTTTPAAGVNKKSTTKNYSIMTGGSTAALTTRKHGISIALEEDDMEQENGVESLS